MISKDKLFSILENEDYFEEENNLIYEPFIKLGTFVKIILNYDFLYNKISPDIKSEDLKKGRLFTETIMFGRAWDYINKIDINNKDHLRVIMDYDRKSLINTLDLAINFFQRSDIEEYERCAFLLKIKKIKRKIEEMKKGLAT